MTNCKECKIGFEKNDNNECIDINECERNSDICGNDEPCENTYGSYSCKGIKQDLNTNKLKNYYYSAFIGIIILIFALIYLKRLL